MVAGWVVVSVVLTVALLAIPRLVLAQVRGRAYTQLLGAGPLFEPTDDHGGLRRVNLGLDEAAVLEVLRDVAERAGEH